MREDKKELRFTNGTLLNGSRYVIKQKQYLDDANNPIGDAHYSLLVTSDRNSIEYSATRQEFRIFGDCPEDTFTRAQVLSPASTSDLDLLIKLGNALLCSPCGACCPINPCADLPPGFGRFAFRVINNEYQYQNPQNDGCVVVINGAQDCSQLPPCPFGACLSQAPRWDTFLALIAAQAQSLAPPPALVVTYTNSGTYADFVILVDLSQIGDEVEFCNDSLQVCVNSCPYCVSYTFRINITSINVDPAAPTDCVLQVFSTCSDLINIPYTVSPGETIATLAAQISDTIKTNYPGTWNVDTITGAETYLEITIPCDNPELAIFDTGAGCNNPTKPRCVPTVDTLSVATGGCTPEDPAVQFNLNNFSCVTDDGQTVEVVITQELVCCPLAQ